MRDIVWSRNLSVEVDEIDADHRKLVQLFNLLNQAVTAGESPEYVAAVLEELINCTAWHFSHEERLMLKYGYGETAAHKAEHRELIAFARELQQDLADTDSPVANEHLDIMERWLTEHILTTDMRLGAFLALAM